MSTTAVKQAIRDFNNGVTECPYMPGTLDHDAYNRMIEHKQGEVK